MCSITPNEVKNQSTRKKGSRPIVPSPTMTRKLQPKTLNLKGVIKGRNVIILIYFGNTHNCIGIVLTKQLNIFV